MATWPADYRNSFPASSAARPPRETRAARRLSRGPEAMALIATAIGILSVIGGLAGSWQWDLPTGPAIVACAALIFMLALACPEHERGVGDDREVG